MRKAAASIAQASRVKRLADSRASDGAEILATRWLTDPRAENHDLQAFVEALLATASEHEERAGHAAAYFIYYFLYDIGVQDADTILAIGRNAEAMDDRAEARRVYGMALEAFPDNAEVKAKIEALGAE